MKKIIKNIGLGIGFLLLIVVGFLLYVSPQKTKPFTDTNGQVIDNSIAEIKTIPINGYPQRLLIRGKDKNNPVLLHVHGGPGAPDYPFFGDANLEDSFTICYWEQRGAGASYSADIPANTMNLDNIIADGIAVTKFLKDHLKKEKIYLQGHSWGTNVGINMAHRHPELYHAYIGIGQMANSHLSEQKSYDFTLAAAEKANDKEGVALLQKIGRPPYKTDAEWLKNVMPERGIMRKYEGPEGRVNKSIPEIYWTFITYSGYSIQDKLNLLNGNAFSMQNLWKVAIQTNLFEQVPSLEIPVYIIQGKYDMHTVTEIAKSYFDVLEAPTKQYFEFEKSAHNPHLTEFDNYKNIIQTIVLRE